MGSIHDWLMAVEQFYENNKHPSGCIILLPRYRPELCEEIARHLSLEYFDFRQEEMLKLGPEAATLELESLNNTLRRQAEKGGIFAQNVEALLCVKSEEERRAWLESFLDTDWPNPVFLPLAIYQGDVPEEHERVCDLELMKMPRQSRSGKPESNQRMKFNLQDTIRQVSG